VDELHAIRNPHDALFRGVFGDPERAGELLRSALPDDVVAAIDWRTLRREEGSFVDEALRGQQADLLFAADIGNRPTLLYLLFEHKSDEDPFTAAAHALRGRDLAAPPQRTPGRTPPATGVAADPASRQATVAGAA
jgi:hypothetical protein